MEKLKMLVRSRKFWAALVGLAMVVARVFAPDLPLSDEQASNMVYLLVAYILGVSLEDGLGARVQGGTHG